MRAHHSKCASRFTIIENHSVAPQQPHRLTSGLFFVPLLLSRRRRKIFFEKLSKYIGQGIKGLIDRPDGRYCFRLHRDRVYYVSEAQVSVLPLPRDRHTHT